ncbi:MAG: flagellar hook-length control protein FliK [Firmicutes bacterium]|nr:flagellar hook-length control protein FliK [Bacillota bacterium]
MKNTDNKQFYQIPMIIDGNEENGELYILKDKKNKNKDYSKNTSVFISMDYAYLGRVDTMINKEEKNLGFQFTLENEDSLKLIRQNYHKLEEMLKEKGYSIRNVSFGTDKERKNIIQVFKEENDGDKRFCFDLRV